MLMIDDGESWSTTGTSFERQVRQFLRVALVAGSNDTRIRRISSILNEPVFDIVHQIMTFLATSPMDIAVYYYTV